MKKNEPVYIDGINISECAYALAPVNYQKEISCIACKASITKLNFCKRNPDCYFKQLKRKELEYCKLKQEYDEAFGAIDNVRQAKEDLQKENKDLRKEIAFGNNGTLSDKIRAEVFKDLNKENNQLKQALEEIREIVSSTLDCGEWIGQGDNKMEKILNKISEVKNANIQS